MTRLAAALCALCLLALAPRAARAQEAAPWSPDTAPLEAALDLTGPVVSVRIEPALPAEDPWARTGLTPSTPFTAARAREALRVALASGTFATASVSARPVPGGVEVIVRGERRYRIVSLEVRGAVERDPELVREESDLHTDMEVTEAGVSEALRRVEQAYRDAGFPDARARPEWQEGERPGERRLTLRVEEASGLRVRDIALVGVTPELVEEARAALGIAVGDLASPRRVHLSEETLAAWLRARGRLDATARAEVVPLGRGAVRVRYEVTLGPRYELAWRGNFAMPDEALVEALRLGEEQGYSEASLASFSARVQDFYARRGWHRARVRAAASSRDGARVITLSVYEGPQVFVRALRFEGARVLSQEALEALVTAAAVAELPAAPTPLRGRVHRERTYTPGVYASAAQRIVDAYRERGYLDATVATPTADPVDTPEGPRLDVTFRVTEGPQSFVEELAFEGNRAVPSATLAGVWDMRLGAPLSHREISEARLRLGDWYREQGYAFARVEPELERSPDHTRARVRVVLHEGPRVRIGRVEFRGQRVVRPSVMATRLSMREGDVFTLSAQRASQRQLYELGVFTSVNVGLQDGDVEAPVKTLLVRVVEERRLGLELRAGFSFGQGARVGLELGWLDLFGLAMNVSVRPEVGYLLPLPFVAPTPPGTFAIPDWGVERLTGRLPVSLAFPYVPLLGPRFSASIDAVASRVLQPWSYDLVTVGVGGTLTWRPLQRLSLSYTTELQRINVGLFGAGTIQGNLYDNCIRTGLSMETCARQARDGVAALLRYVPGVSDLLAFRLGAVYDGRDNPLTPRRGLYASVIGEMLDLLGFESDTESARPSELTAHVEARVTAYLPLPVLDMVLALSARGGRNFTLSGTASRTHPSRLFWLGGSSSMRAWAQNQLVAQDTLDELAQAAPADRATLLNATQGGEFYLNFVADLRVPLGLCIRAGTCLELGAFLDVGNVWKRPPDRLAEWARLRYSPGVGARVTSPVGIIALDFGFVTAPDPLANESVFQTVQFYLGNTL